MKTQSKLKHFEEKMIGPLLETAKNLADVESWSDPPAIIW